MFLSADYSLFQRLKHCSALCDIQRQIRNEDSETHKVLKLIHKSNI